MVEDDEGVRVLADIAHFHLFSRDRECGIMDSLRYQANVVDEPADRGICGADVGRYRALPPLQPGQGARHHG